VKEAKKKYSQRVEKSKV